MKKLLALSFVALAVHLSYGQNVSKNLKWLNKNAKDAENITGNGSKTVYGATLEFTAENIRAYKKENQILIPWTKVNEVNVTTWSEKSKYMKITMGDDDNTQIVFDCQKCEEMAQKIGQTSAALGGKPQLYTTDMSKVTSEDIFGK